jgi:hypothetical protein
MRRRIYFILAVIVALVASFAYFREAEAPIDHLRETPDPATTANKPPKAATQAYLGESITMSDVTIKPYEILEDSRCPVDVICIQAGTVRIKAMFTSGLGTVSQEFKLNMPITTEAEQIILTKVLPERSSKEQLEPGDYLFVFEVSKLETI